MALIIDDTIEAIVMPDGEEVPLGKKPTGNIDIIESGVTDVAGYATATVPSANFDSVVDNYFTTRNGQRQWHNEGYFLVENGDGWIREGGYVVIDRNYVAVPANTSVTPTTSAQTIGGNNYMMEGAVTVNPIPSQYIVPEGTKSITSNGTGIDVTEYAAVDVAVPSGGATLQSKTLNVSSAGTTTVTPDTGYDGLDEVEVNVPSASFTPYEDFWYDTANGQRRWNYEWFSAATQEGWASTAQGSDGTFNAVPANTTVTPTESAQTIGGANTMMEGAVTVAAIPSNYVGSGITRRSSTDLTASGATVSVPSGYYASNASKAVASGTEGTPTATKGTVSNHSVSVTPSVTNTAGYISGGTKTGTGVSVSASELVSGTVNITSSGNTDVTNYATASVAAGSATASATKGTVSNNSVTVTPSVTRTAGYVTAGSANGTAVTVSASELVSGSQTITENGTVDVTNLAEVVVDVSGGGSSTIQVGTKTATLSAAASSIQFTGLSGNPTSFVVTSSADVSTGGTMAAAVAYDGTSVFGMDLTSQAEADTGYSKSYSSGTLTITATTASFQANTYKLVYTYGGSSADIHTADVQVGSGATSITFSGLSGNPLYWSCIFKNDFGTSSGYQRVIAVANDSSSTYGLAFDSSAKALTAWSASYSGGALTISSSGTNNGGYFHQPGYYQLTYAVDDSAPSYQTKSAYATTSAQTITPDAGYDALESVSIGAVSQTNLTAENIKSGTTISISNGQSNIWSVTGTYTGGGGGSSDVATGTLTVASNVNTSTSTEITTTSTIGFTPKAFLFYRSDRSATSNHVNQASFVTLGTSYYVRTMTRYSSNALSTSGNTNNWTTQTAGYLYFNNNTVYFRSSSSYILPSGTWYWVAVK